MTIDLAAYGAAHSSLQFARIGEDILEVIIARAGRHNAADEAMHRDLATVWRRIDADDAVPTVTSVLEVISN